MAYGVKDVRTVMDPMDNQYHFVLIIILISLIIAAGISLFFTSGQGPDFSTDKSWNSPYDANNSIESDKPSSWIVRILWFDDTNRTYSFQDYPSELKPDPKTYTFTGVSPTGSKPAMIRFLSWDGNTERMVGAQYIIDQEDVTSILNRYSLTASKSPDAISSMKGTTTPKPAGTPNPEMLIPEAGFVCQNADGTYTARFGYISRHDHPVSVPIGEQNRFYPGEADRGQPDIFLPGVHRDAVTITYPSDATNQMWSLMNKQASAGTVPALDTSINIDPKSGYAPLEVRFSQRSSGNIVTNPVSGVWILGDGTTINQTGAFSHRYENPGMYQVRYIVSNMCGQASDSEVIRVYRTSYSWTPHPDDPATITFRETSEGTPTVFFWDFGDGYTSWERNPVHIYARPGTYHVGLTISGEHGKGTAVKAITIP
jgi:PKD repeat protein